MAYDSMRVMMERMMESRVPSLIGSVEILSDDEGLIVIGE
jgi:hypothetical protein